MIVTFVNRWTSKISVLHLPSEISGKFWITEKQELNVLDIIGIEEINGEWVAVSNKNYSLVKTINVKENTVTTIESVILKPLGVYRVINSFTGEDYYFYTEPSTIDRVTFEKYYISKSISEISIGSDESNDIIYKMFGNSVSSVHARLERKNGKWKLYDKNSKNFTFYNDSILIDDSVDLEFGDIITILGLKIVIGLDFISINNPDSALIINNEEIKAFKLSSDKKNISKNVGVDISYFYRSPRLKHEIVSRQIKIEPPPQKQNENEIPIALTLGSSLTMGLASLANGVLTVYTTRLNGNDWLTCMPTLIMSGSMVIGTVLWPVFLKKATQKNSSAKEQKRYVRYMKYIGDLRAELNSEIDKQSRILKENYPTSIQCVNRAINQERNLWERSIFHGDFLNIRLGIGNVKLSVDLSFPDEKMTLVDDSLADEMFKLTQEEWDITQVPIAFSLYTNYLTGIVGSHKAIFNFFHSLVLQICTLHSYNEVKIVLIANEKNIDEWSYVRFLPHLFSDDRQERYVVTTLSEAQYIDMTFKKIIAERAEQTNDKNSNNIKIPHYVFIFLQDYRKVQIKSYQELIENAQKIGVSMLFFSEQYEALPRECQAIIEIDDNGNGKAYSNAMSSSDELKFQIDEFQDADVHWQYATMLANTYLEINSKSKLLPKSVTFLEMMNVSKVEHLNIIQRWRENDGSTTLATPIGIDSEGKHFMLDLHEEAHGPHGLIAGMTGSGKSEFIITYIISLALHYNPDTVAFLLIDYKGAGLTGAFENKDPEHGFRLPHLVGTITNLDGSAIQRALVSIETELKRRQEIFRETTQKYDTGTMNIYQYQKLHREGKVNVPLPHLFIVSDEFAELKDQKPEFMEKLISTARIGRSLGVHLILATQKPSGVVNEQIWSNSKFRVCLKVQERVDSVDVIKRPDAAALSVTGRFYLQVGYNELFSIGQSAWSGATYIPEQDFVKKDMREVALIDYSGNTIDSKKISSLYDIGVPDSTKKQKTQLTAIVNHIITVANGLSFKPYSLWEEPLPEQILISEISNDIPALNNLNEVRFLIGKWDNLYQRKQPVLTSSLTNDGNVVLYGAGGSGKQIFLQAAIDSMLMWYASDRLHLYILDFDSDVLKEYLGFPQVGDVISLDEGEKINNLFKTLEQKLRQRKKLLSTVGGSFNKYNDTHDEVLPSIVIVIHSYAKFAETYPNFVSRVADLLQGTKYGIYFIITTPEQNCFTSKVRQQLSQVYTLRLNQESDYSALFGGRTYGLYPQDYVGRGLTKKKIDGLDRDIFEFQVAKLSPDNDRKTVLVSLKKWCIQKCEGILPADKILVLPDKINIDTSGNVLFDIKNMFIGYDYSSMKPEYVNIADEYIHCIFASDQNSLIAFSQGFAEFIASALSTSHDSVYVLDPQGLYYEDSTQNYKYRSDELSNTLHELLQEAQCRNELLTAYEEGRDTNEDNIKFSLIVCIIVSYSGLQMKLSEEEWNIFLEILQYSRQLGFRFEVFSDSSSASFLNSDWYLHHAKDNTTLWIGDGLRTQTRVQWKGRLQEPLTGMSDTYGYAIRSGKTKLVKLISTYLKEEDEL